MGWVTVGIDAGGTWLRVTVADLDGVLLRRVVVPSGRADRGWDFASILGAALRDAVAGDRVAAGVGSNASGMVEGWRAAFPGGPPLTVVAEGVLAVEPSTPAAVVLTAGTGSACTVVEFGQERSHVPDRWPQGGSGVPTGLRVLDAVRSSRSGGPSTCLDADLAGAGAEHLLSVTLDEVLAGSPVYREVGLVAPLADGAARRGDVVALAVCEESARQLWALVEGQDLARFAGGRLHVVGSVAAPGTVVGALLEGLLPDGLDVHWVGDQDGVAARWAAASLVGRACPPR